MTIVEEEQVEHVVQEQTVQRMYCDVCGGEISEEEPFETLDVAEEPRHAHEACVADLTDAPPSPAPSEDDDSSLLERTSLLPPVVADTAAKAKTNIVTPVSEAATRSNVVRALHAFFTAFLFVFWPVIGLWAASNRSFRGMELEGNSPLYRYLFGMEFFMMAVVFSTVTAAYVFLASKMPNIWPVSLLVAIFFSLLTIGLFKPRD